jgi:hypothetical protein
VLPQVDAIVDCESGEGAAGAFDRRASGQLLELIKCTKASLVDDVEHWPDRDVQFSYCETLIPHTKSNPVSRSLKLSF